MIPSVKAIARTEAADAVAHVDAVIATFAGDRPFAYGKNHPTP